MSAASALDSALAGLAAGTPPTVGVLQQFSDLDPASLGTVRAAWDRIPAKQKYLLLDGLHELSKENTLVSFDDLARELLADRDGQVRLRAIRLLEESEDPALVTELIRMSSTDDDPETRRTAASALGRFIELGELEEIPADVHHRAEAALLQLVNGEDQVAIRRSALESLGFSSRPEVVTLIESAFRRENPDWQASALVAMKRSSDERWEDAVISRLADDNPGIRLAAVEAAGELRLAAARRFLFEVLEEEDDTEISTAAIWSLSQLGGEDVRLYIQNLLDLAEDDEDVQFLEAALENVEFTEELNRFDLMSVEPDLDD